MTEVVVTPVLEEQTAPKAFAGRARLGVYREDGWLPVSRQRFRVDQPDLIQALCADGLPDDEAEQVGSLVRAERDARLARHG